MTLATDWFYDAASHVTDVDNNNAYLHYTFEDSGLTLSEADTNMWAASAVNTTSYTRDIDGNIADMTYPAGDVPPYSLRPTELVHRADWLEPPLFRGRAGQRPVAAQWGCVEPILVPGQQPGAGGVAASRRQ